MARIKFSPKKEEPLRKRAEEAVKASEGRARDQAARLRAVLDAAPALIWVAHDRECRSITGNRAAYIFSRMREGDNLSKSGPEAERLAHYRIFKDGVELAPEQHPEPPVNAPPGLSHALRLP